MSTNDFDLVRECLEEANNCCMGPERVEALAALDRIQAGAAHTDEQLPGLADHAGGKHTSPRADCFACFRALQDEVKRLREVALAPMDDSAAVKDYADRTRESVRRIRLAAERSAERDALRGFHGAEPESFPGLLREAIAQARAEERERVARLLEDPYGERIIAAAIRALPDEP